MPADIRLIATDLDGTLIGSVHDLPLYATFSDRLGALRRIGNVKWAACTGRTWSSFNEFFSPMRSLGILPDFVIVRHAYIYHRTPGGYVPNIVWNLHMCRHIWVQRLAAQRALRHWREMIMGAALGVRVVDRSRDELRLRFESEESARSAGDLLRGKLAPYRHISVFVHLREVHVRPVPFTKGLAVSELASHLGLRPDQVLAIGNGHNDISMFAPDVAAHTGCPGNSEAEVMRVVSAAGGHVASARSLGGVIEILDAYAGGTVDSALPDWWVPPSSTSGPPARRRRSRPHTRHLRRAGVALFAGVVYIVLLVFAQFGVLPVGGDILLKPIEWLGMLFERALAWLYAR